MHRDPPSVGETVSALDNLGNFHAASLQRYFPLLTAPNTAQGRGRYTVVLWTGPSGKEQAERIAHASAQAQLIAVGRRNRPGPNGHYYTGSNTSFECWKCGKFQKTFKNFSELFIFSLVSCSRMMFPFIPVLTTEILIR